MTSKYVIVMQGRVNSVRLPAKGFFTFYGVTIWERMCDIAREVECATEIVFATGDVPANELIRPLVERDGVRFHLGSEANVLERFCSAIASSDADYVIRLTCDNYLAQPEVIDALAAAVSDADADYGFVEPLSHYAGEVIRRSVLMDQLAGGAYSDSAKEHVTWDVRASDTLKHVALPSDFMGLDHETSLTLDTIDDFVAMKTLEQRTDAFRPVRCLEALRTLNR